MKNSHLPLPSFHAIQVLQLHFVTSLWLTWQCEMSKTELSLSLHFTSWQTHERCQERRFCSRRNMRFTTCWLCQTKCCRSLCNACACATLYVVLIFWLLLSVLTVLLTFSLMSKGVLRLLRGNLQSLITLTHLAAIPFLYFLWSLPAFSQGEGWRGCSRLQQVSQRENNFGSALFHHLLLSEVCFWSRSLNTCFLPWCVKSGTLLSCWISVWQILHSWNKWECATGKLWSLSNVNQSLVWTCILVV